MSCQPVESRPSPPKSQSRPAGSIQDAAGTLAPGTFVGDAIPFVP
jgi:hypothetical protein